MRNPTWTWDELIVALDFYLTHSPAIPEKHSQEITELSQKLRQVGRKALVEINDVYRNNNSVYMKLMNFRAIDPSYTGSGLKAGSKGEQYVWDYYATDPQKLKQVARNILATSELDDAEPVLDITDADAKEGSILTRRHVLRERNERLVRSKKRSALKQFGRLRCEGCGFDFAAAYGERGEGFLECHHTIPLAELEPNTRTKLSDLALVCSNCHRMIHRRRQWLTMSELKRIVRDNKG